MHDFEAELVAAASDIDVRIKRIFEKLGDADPD
jgi:hypothetical protein